MPHSDIFLSDLGMSELKHDSVVHFDLFETIAGENNVNTSSSRSSSASIGSPVCESPAKQAVAEEPDFSDADDDFTFGDLRSAVESMIEQFQGKAPGKAQVSFWKGDQDRPQGPISEPVSRSTSTINNLGQLLAFAPGRDAISQPVSRSASHINGLGSIWNNTHGADVMSVMSDPVSKSASALSGLGSIWADAPGRDSASQPVSQSASHLSNLDSIWSNAQGSQLPVPRSATALGHTWNTLSVHEKVVPRSVSAMNNLGQMWTGGASEVPAEEDPSEISSVPSSTASPTNGPLSSIPRVAPMEFGAAEPNNGSPTLSKPPLQIPLVPVVSQPEAQAVPIQPGGIVHIAGQAYVLMPTTPLGGPPAETSFPVPVEQGSPRIVTAVPQWGQQDRGTIMTASPEPRKRHGKQDRKKSQKPQTFQNIQVLSDKVDSRVVEQGYYLAPTSTEVKPAKSKSRASPPEPKSISCLPTYTYDYGDDVDSGVWDILRSTMRRST